LPNAKVLSEKQAIVEALAERIGKASSGVLVDYKGINVAEDTALRRELRAAGIEYSVVKNTLLRFAVDKCNYNEFDSVLNGTTSLATTEGALLASISRGMSVITEAGGAHTKIYMDTMTRAPVFRVDGIDHATEVMAWISENADTLGEAVSKTTSHGRLLDIEPYPNGRNLYLRFVFDTGDAMGMNMATIATEAACGIIEERTGAKLVSVSGNMCTDKKPAAINILKGRGKTVLAEARIPASVVEGRLHTTTAAVVETNYRKNLMGSAMAVSLGSNAHAANMVAALFLATGQDPAQVIGGSMTLTSCEDVDGDLYICVRMPNVEVGTVGGGTRLPCQSEALSVLGCLGTGKARKFAEIVAATVLAGELSTLGAQSAGHLGKAHEALGR
jgi:hydroxymethylglutaryl-CoA reductase (NADPH)